MSINSAQIRGNPGPGHDFKETLVKVNAGGSLATDVAAANVSLAHKRALIDLRAATATRVGINASALDLPEKAALLAAAGV